MQLLPEEIIENILEYLEDPKDLSSLSRVSSKLKRIADGDKYWKKHLPEADQNITSGSAKSKFFEIQKKQRTKKRELKEALQNLKPSQAKQNLENKQLIVLYENDCVDLIKIQNLTPEEASKLTCTHIHKLILKKYITVDKVLYNSTDEIESTTWLQIHILDDPNLDPLRDAGILNPDFEKSLKKEEWDHIADKDFQECLIKQSTSLSIIKTLQSHEERRVIVANLKQGDPQVTTSNFPY